MRWREAKKGSVSRGIHPKNNVLFPLSTLMQRFKACIIDSFMILMPILYLVFYIVFGSREAFSEHMLEGWLLIVFPHFCITTTFLFLKAQTPGMKAYELVLIDTKTRAKPTFLALCIRYAMMLVTTFSLLGLLAPLLRKDKLSLYDIVSHTAIIEQHQK